MKSILERPEVSCKVDTEAWHTYKRVPVYSVSKCTACISRLYCGEGFSLPLSTVLCLHPPLSMEDLSF